MWFDNIPNLRAKIFHPVSQPQQVNRSVFAINVPSIPDQKRGEFSASIIKNFQDTLNSQINTPAVTRSKLAVAYQNNVLSFTFMSLTVEPSLTLENTFVPCLSY